MIKEASDGKTFQAAEGQDQSLLKMMKLRHGWQVICLLHDVLCDDDQRFPLLGRWTFDFPSSCMIAVCVWLIVYLQMPVRSSIKGMPFASLFGRPKGPLQVHNLPFLMNGLAMMFGGTSSLIQTLRGWLSLAMSEIKSWSCGQDHFVNSLWLSKPVSNLDVRLEAAVEDSPAKESGSLSRSQLAVSVGRCM